MSVTKRRVLWKGSYPRDTNNRRARVIIQKKKSHKSDEAFLIPLDQEPHLAPVDLVCQHEQHDRIKTIMVRPYFLSEKMTFTVNKRATKAWDSSFTLLPMERTGMASVME